MKQNFENDQKITVVKYAKVSMNSLKVKKFSSPKDFL
jgi:hypothetical protein